MILTRDFTYEFSETPSDDNINVVENAIGTIMINDLGFEPTSDTQDMVSDIITTIEDEIITEDGDINNAYIDFDLGLNAYDLSVDIKYNKIVFTKIFQ